MDDETEITNIDRELAEIVVLVQDSFEQVVNLVKESNRKITTKLRELDEKVEKLCSSNP